MQLIWNAIPISMKIKQVRQETGDNCNWLLHNEHSFCCCTIFHKG